MTIEFQISVNGMGALLTTDGRVTLQGVAPSGITALDINGEGIQEIVEHDRTLYNTQMPVLEAL